MHLKIEPPPLSIVQYERIPVTPERVGNSTPMYVKLLRFNVAGRTASQVLGVGDGLIQRQESGEPLTPALNRNSK